MEQPTRGLSIHYSPNDPTTSCSVSHVERPNAETDTRPLSSHPTLISDRGRSESKSHPIPNAYSPHRPQQNYQSHPNSSPRPSSSPALGDVIDRTVEISAYG